MTHDNSMTADRRLKPRRAMSDTNLLLIITIVVFVVMYASAVLFLGSGFTKPQTFFNILNNDAALIILSCGMSIVMISGGIDLAVGSTLVAVGATLMFFVNSYPTGILTAAGITGVPAFAIGIVLCIAMGCALGGISGFLIAKQKLPAFIGYPNKK